MCWFLLFFLFCVFVYFMLFYICDNNFTIRITAQSHVMLFIWQHLSTIHKRLNYLLTYIYFVNFQTAELPSQQAVLAGHLLKVCCCLLGVYRHLYSTDTKNAELHACLSGKPNACASAKF